MSFEKRFCLADDYIVQTDQLVLSITDPFVKSRFTGFLAVSAVTVYELAIKDIFIDFSYKKNKTFGHFVTMQLDGMNGNIMINKIDQRVSMFGEKYAKRFKKNLASLEEEKLIEMRSSVRSSYGNLVTWRHKFAHEGIIPENASYEEAKKSYELGKLLIACLNQSMKN